MIDTSVKTPRFVAPDGSLVIDTGKSGLLMGNRGILRPSHFELPQPHVSNKAWITCLINKNGLPIEKTEGKYTKLFFLDEVTAFAAGHRPCFSCQRQRYKIFVEMWEKVTHKPATEMDSWLHHERCDENGRKKLYPEILGNLPSGVMVRLSGDASGYLLLWQKLFPWTIRGYGPPIAASMSTTVHVMTPYSMVQMFNSGFPLLVNREETIHSSVLECI